MERRKLYHLGLVLLAVAAAPILAHGAENKLAGYLTIGENVIVTSEYLQSGDQVVVTNENGAVVFDRVITSQTSFAPLDLPNGLYQVVIERKGQPIVSVKVPLKLEL